MKLLRGIPWYTIGGTIITVGIYAVSVASDPSLDTDPNVIGVTFVIGIVFGFGGMVLDLVRWGWL